MIDVVGERFRVKVVGEENIEEARALLNTNVEPKPFVSGTVVRGNGGFNSGYSWHLDPETIRFVEMSIELCDGTPSYVEAHLDEWIRDVKQYCPWGSSVVAEE